MTTMKVMKVINFGYSITDRLFNRILAGALEGVVRVHVPSDGVCPGLNANRLLGLGDHLNYGEDIKELMGHGVLEPESDLAKSCVMPDVIMVMLPDNLAIDENDHTSVRMLFYFLRQQLPNVQLVWVADRWIYEEEGQLRGELSKLLDQPEQNSFVVLLPGADSEGVADPAIDACTLPKSVAVYDPLLGRRMQYLLRWICIQLSLNE